MIEHVNETIERTHRLTVMPKDGSVRTSSELAGMIYEDCAWYG